MGISICMSYRAFYDDGCFCLRNKCEHAAFILDDHAWFYDNVDPMIYVGY